MNNTNPRPQERQKQSSETQAVINSRIDTLKAAQQAARDIWIVYNLGIQPDRTSVNSGAVKTEQTPSPTPANPELVSSQSSSYTSPTETTGPVTDTAPDPIVDSNSFYIRAQQAVEAAFNDVDDDRGLAA